MTDGPPEDRANSADLDFAPPVDQEQDQSLDQAPVTNLGTSEPLNLLVVTAGVADSSQPAVHVTESTLNSSATLARASTDITVLDLVQAASAVRIEQGNGRYELVQPDNTRLQYAPGPDGKPLLEKSTSAGGVTTTYEYAPDGGLTAINHPQLGRIPQRDGIIEAGAEPGTFVIARGDKWSFIDPKGSVDNYDRHPTEAGARLLAPEPTISLPIEPLLDRATIAPRLSPVGEVSAADLQMAFVQPSPTVLENTPGTVKVDQGNGRFELVQADGTRLQYAPGPEGKPLLQQASGTNGITRYEYAPDGGLTAIDHPQLGRIQQRDGIIEAGGEPGTFVINRGDKWSLVDQKGNIENYDRHPSQADARRLPPEPARVDIQPVIASNTGTLEPPVAALPPQRIDQGSGRYELVESDGSRAQYAPGPDGKPLLQQTTGTNGLTTRYEYAPDGGLTAINHPQLGRIEQRDGRIEPGAEPGTFVVNRGDKWTLVDQRGNVENYDRHPSQADARRLPAETTPLPAETTPLPAETTPLPAASNLPPAGAPVARADTLAPAVNLSPPPGLGPGLNDGRVNVAANTGMRTTNLAPTIEQPTLLRTATPDRQTQALPNTIAARIDTVTRNAQTARIEPTAAKVEPVTRIAGVPRVETLARTETTNRLQPAARLEPLVRSDAGTRALSSPITRIESAPRVEPNTRVARLEPTVRIEPSRVSLASRVDLTPRSDLLLLTRNQIVPRVEPASLAIGAGRLNAVKPGAEYAPVKLCALALDNGALTRKMPTLKDLQPKTIFSAIASARNAERALSPERIALASLLRQPAASARPSERLMIPGMVRPDVRTAARMLDAVLRTPPVNLHTRAGELRTINLVDAVRGMSRLGPVQRPGEKTIQSGIAQLGANARRIEPFNPSADKRVIPGAHKTEQAVVLNGKVLVPGMRITDNGIPASVKAGMLGDASRASKFITPGSARNESVQPTARKIEQQVPLTIKPGFENIRGAVKEASRAGKFISPSARRGKAEAARGGDGNRSTKSQTANEARLPELVVKDVVNGKIDYTVTSIASGRCGEDRYLTGIELIVGSLMAVAAVAKHKEKLDADKANQVAQELQQWSDTGEEPEEGEDKKEQFETELDDDITLAGLQKDASRVLHRPTHLLGKTDTLTGLAALYYGDEQLGWLILELNMGKLRAKWSGDTCLVEGTERMLIELPVHEDINEFRQAGNKHAKKRLITYVRQNAIDRELMVMRFRRLDALRA